MKNLIHPTKLPLLTLGLGGIGMALRFWLFASTDDKGLLEAGHIAVPLVWLLTAVTLVGLFLFTRPLNGQGKYRNNFPASLPAAISCFAAAVMIFLNAMQQLLDSPGALDLVSGILAILAAPCLVLAGVNRYKGQRVSFLYHTVLCLAFTGQILGYYRDWSASPALQYYCFQLLATIGLMLTAYHRAEFDARIGSRKNYAFVSLAALYFCCLAVPESDNKLYYLVMAAWVFTNLCSMRPLRRRPRPTLDAEPAAEGPAPEEPRQEEI